MIRYALVDGIKTEPLEKLKGVCTGCGNPLIAKCGQIVVHHWAHAKNTNCDSWWEPMTQWHIDWQNQFPESWREYVFRDQSTGEFHRADVHTDKGVTLEFQHSFISTVEMQSRNNFYRKIVWVVDGRRFGGNFEVTTSIPNPDSPLLADFDFGADKDGLAKFCHFKIKKELNDYGGLVRIYSIRDSELQEVSGLYKKESKVYWLFNWKHKHLGWLQCTAPVFLDFGDDKLYWIKKRKQTLDTLYYLKIIKKAEFIKKYGADFVIETPAE